MKHRFSILLTFLLVSTVSMAQEYENSPSFFHIISHNLPLDHSIIIDGNNIEIFNNLTDSALLLSSEHKYYPLYKSLDTASLILVNQYQPIKPSHNNQANDTVPICQTGIGRLRIEAEILLKENNYKPMVTFLMENLPMPKFIITKLDIFSSENENIPIAIDSVAINASNLIVTVINHCLDSPQLCENNSAQSTDIEKINPFQYQGNIGLFIENVDTRENIRLSYTLPYDQSGFVEPIASTAKKYDLHLNKENLKLLDGNLRLVYIIEKCDQDSIIEEPDPFGSAQKCDWKIYYSNEFKIRIEKQSGKYDQITTD